MTSGAAAGDAVCARPDESGRTAAGGERQSPRSPWSSVTQRAAGEPVAANGAQAAGSRHAGGETRRDRQTELQIDLQSDSQTNLQADSKADSKADSQTDSQTDSQRSSQAASLAGSQTDSRNAALPPADRLTAFGWPAIRDPLEVEAGHPRGFWITRNEWSALGAEQCPDARWMLLPRLAWLAPRAIDDASAARGQNALLDADAMLARAAELPGPALVAALVRGRDAVWRETVRGFIVPDDWPARAAAFAGR
ncbi:DUF1853 family protein [Burkholderia singularis]|uniref:DUF1853 family protein n=1 Tax=Burkholderia singularis TaxID=1503053 RepID=UPI0009EB9F7C